MTFINLIPSKSTKYNIAFKRHFFAVLILIGITLLFSRDIAFGAPLCTEIMIVDETSKENKILEEKYDQFLDKVIQWEETFNDQLVDYAKALKSRKDQYRAITIMNYGPFSEVVYGRLKILLQRPTNKNYQKKLETQLKQIDQAQKKLGSWQSLRKSSAAANLLLVESGPKLDKLNIQKKRDLELWNDSMSYVEELAARSHRHLNRWELAKIAAVVQGHRDVEAENVSIFDAHYLSYNDINFMYTKSENGRKVLDPTNSFIAGPMKEKALENLLEFIAKQRKETHPVVLAAQVRQRIVSIHPLQDANGRFARLVANYILMRAGYPPAYIPAGTKESNMSVALFPLKNFHDQISPEETIQLMVDGVKRSQDLLINNF